MPHARFKVQTLEYQWHLDWQVFVCHVENSNLSRLWFNSEHSMLLNAALWLHASSMYTNTHVYGQFYVHKYPRIWPVLCTQIPTCLASSMYTSTHVYGQFYVHKYPRIWPVLCTQIPTYMASFMYANTHAYGQLYAPKYSCTWPVLCTQIPKYMWCVLMKWVVMSANLISRKYHLNMQRWFPTILTFCH